MTWVKLDDTFPDNPKIVEAPPGAITLYIFGLCYASRHLTDGHLTRAAVAKFGVHKWGRSADVLVSLKLWEETDNGWTIHDYLEHQRSAEEVRELSEKRAVAGRKGGSKPKQVAKQVASDLPSKQQAETEAETEPSSSPPVTDTRKPADPPNPEDEDFVERTLTATFDLMAEQTLDRVRAEGQTVHNPTAWKRKAAANFAETHLEAALHHLGTRTAGRYYDLHVELAEQLDPRCGPADGGAKRAEQQRLATLHQLHPDQGAA